MSHMQVYRIVIYQRRPDGRAVLVLLVQGSIFLLEALTVESVVLRLLDDRGDKVALLGNIACFLDLLRRPLGGSPVVCQVHLNSLRKGFYNLLHSNANSISVNAQKIVRIIAYSGS